MITQYLEPYLIQIAEYGYEARLYKCGTKWTVNFPQPLVSCTQTELEKYQLFIEFVLYYVQELNK